VSFDRYEMKDELTELLSEHVLLKEKALDMLIDWIERRDETVENVGRGKGHKDGFVAGLEAAKKIALDEAGVMFARNNDDYARFLRIFANETMTKQIAEAKKRTK
jgi:hypothetical protein